MHECSGLNGGPYKRYAYLELMNVTVFGKRLFEDVNMLRFLRCGHPDLQLVLNSMTSILKRHRREGHVKREAEIEMIHLQIKEHQGLLAVTKNWKKQGRILP